MITFKSFLAELFDKPWSMVHDDHKTKYYKQDAPKHYPGHKLSNIHAYQLEGDNGHLLSFHRNGVLEAHHIDKDGKSGTMHPEAKKPNPRFYSTMIHHLETNGLHKARTVSVSGFPDQMKHYHKLINKRYGDDSKYEVSHKEETINNHKLHTIHIRPRNALIENLYNIIF